MAVSSFPWAVYSSPATHFSSDVVAHPDLDPQSTLGLVPIKFWQYGLLQQCLKHINLETDMSFDLPTGTHRVYYGHISLYDETDQATYRPSWLSSWTRDTGVTSSIEMPDPLNPLSAYETQTATVYYYYKDITFGGGSPASFTYAGHRSSSAYDRRLTHFPGFFLTPPAEAISAKDPIINGFVPDISATYASQVPPEIDWFWDDAPQTADAPTLEPLAFGTGPTDETLDENNVKPFWYLVVNATSGQIISCPNGTHTGKGRILMSGRSGDDITTPIVIQGATFGSCIWDDKTAIDFNNCEWVRFKGIKFTGDPAPSGDYQEGLIRVQGDSIVHITSNVFYQTGHTSPPGDNQANLVVSSGNTTVGYNTTDGHKSTWQSFFVSNSATAQYNRFYRNHFLNNTFGNGSQDMQFGAANNATQASRVYNTLVDHNWHQRYKGESGETSGFKGRGHICAHNLIDCENDGTGKMSSRAVKDSLFFANLNLRDDSGGSTEAGMKMPGQIQGQGTDDHTTIYDADIIVALNWVDYNASSSGQVGIMYLTGIVDDRWVAKKVAYIANFVEAGTGVMFGLQEDTDGASPATLYLPTELYFEGNASGSTGSVYNDDGSGEDKWGIDWHAAANNVFKNSGTIDAATGADPVFANRTTGGQGLPTHVNWDVPNNYHFPGYFEDPANVRDDCGCGYTYV